MKKLTIHLIIMTIAALLIRAAVFHWYIQHEERYNQPDSPGYHFAALCIAHGYGMHRLDNKMPIFWRTPGYPVYLAQFIKNNPPKNGSFEACTTAHKKSIWMQILLTTFVPFFVFLLGFVLTQSFKIGLIVGWISTFHLGFILASTFLLTDALAQLFFVLFLICLFTALRRSDSAWYIIGAAVSLSIYTWMRPMGQFVAIAALILLAARAINWRKRIGHLLLFLVLFGASIAPWFVRNYRLTGYWTFCPLFGLYFNVFNAPKILARIKNCKLEEAHAQLTQDAGKLTYKRMLELHQQKSPYVVCGEMVCLQTALPLLFAHPFYFIYDWCVEVTKTTFDLYSSQLVTLANNCFKWDPIVEFLDEKLKDCLYKKTLPLGMRIIAWIELIFELLLWIGIICGIYIFVLKKRIPNYASLWVSCLFMIGAVVLQTGGFGYARLRLPIEPLIIILGITFWYYCYKKYKKANL